MNKEQRTKNRKRPGNSIHYSQFKVLNSQLAFTLIELLIVIAILGVLAIVVLVLVNPAEQLARTRDASRITSVTSIGHAFKAYALLHNNTLPEEGATWTDPLITSGELNSNLPAVDYNDVSMICTTNAINNVCYVGDGDSPPVNGVLYTRLESQAQNAACVSGESAWMVYDTLQDRGGTVCTNGAEPAYDASGQTFVN